MYLPSRQELHDYIDQGYVRKQRHPSLPLEVYNYTEQAMFKNYWPDGIRAARGLVMDETGRIVSLPFPKFFNLDEHSEETLTEYKDTRYIIQEKLDGSLITLSNDPEHGLIVASRGSFDSWHAKQAQRIVQEEKYIFPQGFTYIFELIGRENQIVINYDCELKFIILGVIDPVKGEESRLPHDLLAESIGMPGDQIPEGWGNIPINEIKDQIPDNYEGVVIVFEDRFRVKVKSDQYVYLHRLISGLNRRTVWEAMKEGVELASEFPEEFQEWIDQVWQELSDAYTQHEQHAKEVFANVPEGDRKTQALFIKGHTQNPGLVFSLLDGRMEKFNEQIFKLIKPQTETGEGATEVPSTT